MSTRDFCGLKEAALTVNKMRRRKVLRRRQINPDYKGLIIVLL